MVRITLYFVFAALIIACLWGWLRPVPKVHDYLAEGDSIRYYRARTGELLAERTAAQGSVIALRKHYGKRIDSLERALPGGLAWHTQVATVVKDTVRITLRDTIRDSVAYQFGNYTDGYLAAKFEVVQKLHQLKMDYNYTDRYSIAGYWRGTKRDTLAVQVSVANPKAKITGLSTLYVARPADPAPLFSWGVQVGLYFTPAGLQPGVGIGGSLNIRRRRK